MDNRATWLVTGTSNGLGLAIAQHVLEQGHNVISVSRHARADESLVTKSQETHTGSLHHLALDLANPSPDHVKNTLNTFLQAHNLSPSIAVNNAAMTTFGPIETTTPEQFQRVMQVNFFAPLYIIQTLLPSIRSSTSPIKCILNVNSTQGLCADPGEGPYDSSKHALEALTSVLRAEAAPFNIKVLTANLGAFRTNFATSTASGKGNAEYGSLSPPYDGPDHPVNKRMEMVAKYAVGKARGDPAKAAQVLFDAVTSQGEVGRLVEEKGLGRLILGPDAWAKIDRRPGVLREDLDVQKQIVRLTTDLDGL